MFDWTGERIGVLARLWAEGRSAEYIAGELGTGRNGVVGKAHRLGLGEHSQSTRNKRLRAAHKPVREPKPRQTRLVSRGTHFAEGDKPAPALPMMPDGANIPIEQRRTLLELDNSVCKWPFGDPHSSDFFFCGGDAVEGKPYCAGHYRMAYQSRAA